MDIKNIARVHVSTCRGRGGGEFAFLLSAHGFYLHPVFGRIHIFSRVCVGINPNTTISLGTLKVFDLKVGSVSGCSCELCGVNSSLYVNAVPVDVGDNADGDGAAGAEAVLDELSISNRGKRVSSGSQAVFGFFEEGTSSDDEVAVELVSHRGLV